MEVEKRQSKGRFLQFFDWNSKSRKQLFSNSPDIPGPYGVKQGTDDTETLAKSRFQTATKVENLSLWSCGNDFLAELAETMQDYEDWDDLQDAESKACGVLTDMFGQDIHNDGECNVIHNVNIIEDSLQPRKNQTFLEVDFSIDSEDEDNIFGNKMGGKSTCYILDRSSTPRNSSTQLLARRSLESIGCFYHGHIDNTADHINYCVTVLSSYNLFSP